MRDRIYSYPTRDGKLISFKAPPEATPLKSFPAAYLVEHGDLYVWSDTPERCQLALKFVIKPVLRRLKAALNPGGNGKQGVVNV